MESLFAMSAWHWLVLVACIGLLFLSGAAAQDGESSEGASPSPEGVTGSEESSSPSPAEDDVVDGDVLAGYLVGLSAIVCVALSMLLGAVIYALTRKIRKIRKEKRRQSYLHGNDVDLDESLVA